MKREKYFYSNCLLEALKAKIKNPIKVKIHSFHSLHTIWPHFWWSVDNDVYEFVSVKENRKYQVFYFKGYIKSKEEKLEDMIFWAKKCNESFWYPVKYTFEKIKEFFKSKKEKEKEELLIDAYNREHYPDLF